MDRATNTRFDGLSEQVEGLSDKVEGTNTRLDRHERILLELRRDVRDVDRGTRVAGRVADEISGLRRRVESLEARASSRRRPGSPTSSRPRARWSSGS
jgi:hypothetical protein